MFLPLERINVISPHSPYILWCVYSIVMAQANITSLVLIALAVVLGASLLAVAMTPPVYASHSYLHSVPDGCTKDKGNPAIHNPNCPRTKY
jgi:hypothetical protein